MPPTSRNRTQSKRWEEIDSDRKDLKDLVYCPSLKELPPQVSNVLSNALKPDEDVLALVRGDLGRDLKYEDTYLVLTDRRILTLDGKGVLQEVPLSDIKAASLKGYLGTCVLVLDTNKGPRSVIAFTRARKANFEKIVVMINDLTINRVPVLELKSRLRAKQYEAVSKERISRALIQLIRFVRPLWHLMGVAFVLMGLNNLIGLIPPYLMKILIDEVLVPRANFELLLLIVLALLGVNASSTALRVAARYVSLKLNQKLTFMLRARLYEKLQEMSLSFYDRYSRGDLISRVMYDVDRVQYFLTQGLMAIVIDVAMIVFIGAIMLSMNPWLTLIAMLPIPISMAGSEIYRRTAPKYYRKVWRKWSEILSTLSESLSAMILIKTYGKENDMIRRFTSKLSEHITSQLSVFKYEQKFWPAIGLSFTVSNILLWWIGGFQVIQGSLTLGTLTAFASYMWRFYMPINDLLMNIRVVPQSAVASERMFEILNAETETEDSPEAREVDLKGGIEIRNLWFSYDGIHYVLRGVNLKIKPGEHVGIVGPNGSGKSTLIKLLLRLYKPQLGEILLDGVDIRRIKLSSLRKQMAVVLQDPILLDASIAENIMLGKADATLEEIIAAAKAAKAHEFIMRLPEAYDTRVGPRGSLLSGGERQKIAIAMAILKDPKVLILDEPTASLDAIAEKEVSEAIENLMKGRTTIIIAHRLSSLREVDRIVVMDRGRVVEEGTHKELLSKEGGLYKQLYEAQVKGLVRPVEVRRP